MPRAVRAGKAESGGFSDLLLIVGSSIVDSLSARLYIASNVRALRGQRRLSPPALSAFRESAFQEHPLATYRFSAKVISRSTGRSATGAAAYRAGVMITDERTDMTHDYTRRRGVVHAEILTPDDAPEWMQDRAALWNAVEHAERRKDAQLAREIQINLPHELDPETRRNLARDFVEQEFVSRGMVADLTIHAPDPRGDERNHHAHVMLTMRALQAEGFGKKGSFAGGGEILP